MKTSPIGKIKNWVFPEVNDRILHEIDVLNVTVVKTMTLLYGITLFVAMFAELFGILRTKDVTIALVSMATGFILCVVLYFTFGHIKKHDMGNHKLIQTINAIFSVLIILWAMSISARMYNLGHQIVSFYCVVFSLVCFTVIHPAVSIPMFSSAYICLYIIAYAIDGAKELQPFNLLSFMLISVAGSIEKYRVTVDKVGKQLKSEDLNQAYLKIMRHDPLTKAKNRNALIEDSPKYYGKNLTVYVCDIDKFKHLNDRYGHLVGDKALHAFAAVLIDSFGEEGVYRFGGDEFVMITEADDTSLATAWQNVNEKVAAIRIDDMAQAVEFSVGRADGVAQSGEELQKLISRADKELYRLKEQKNNGQTR